jgi:hypothetical protein
VPSIATLCAVGGAFLLLTALSRRPLTALGVCAFLLAAVLFSSAQMQSHLGMPLTLADVQFFFMDPLDDLVLFFNYPTLGLSFLAIIGITIGLVWAGTRLEPARLPANVTPRTRTVRYVVAAAVVMLLALGYSRSAETAHQGTVDDRDAWSAFLAMRRLELADRWMDRINVFFENRDLLATLPPRHEQTRFRPPVLDATPSAEPAVPPAGEPAPPPLPDILMVLEESTFDPSLIARCRLPACQSPMFEAPPARWRSVQSPLLVHTTGGGTWLTEFAFLSGFDWRSFGRGGAYAPVSLAPRLQQSLPKYLRSLGYHTVVFSAVGAEFLRARPAYRYYGFDEFYASQDLKLSNDWHAVRDRRLFDLTLEELARSKDPRPLFVFILTIRNHGPHGEDKGALPAGVRTAEKRLGRGLADYLARLDDSARDYAFLRQAWLDSPRPRVIGWFGDHQPEVSWDFLEKEADVNRTRLASNVDVGQMRYLTWHQLSANFGERGTRTRLEALDAPFMSTELLDFAGLPPDPGMLASQQVMAHCHGLQLDCADRELVRDYLSYRIYDLDSVR